MDDDFVAFCYLAINYVSKVNFFTLNLFLRFVIFPLITLFIVLSFFCSVNLANYIKYNTEIIFN